MQDEIHPDDILHSIQVLGPQAILSLVAAIYLRHEQHFGLCFPRYDWIMYMNVVTCLQAGCQNKVLEIHHKSLLPLQILTEKALAECQDDLQSLADRLGLQRILEVLSRVLELSESPDSGKITAF